MAEGSLKLLRTTDITGGKVDWERVPFCSEEPPNAEHYRLAEGDIVVSRAGSVGASILLWSVPADAVFASYLVRLRPIKPIETRYVAYFLQSADYWAAIARRSAGIAIPNVNASKLATIEIPVAPLDEQRRIVARIEELFSDLDAGAVSLDRVRRTLKRYRASVLKAALEGVLIRGEFRHELLPIAALIDGIGQGWSPRCDRMPAKDPDEWGVIKTTAVQSLRFLPDHNKRLPPPLEPRPRLGLTKDDLLITRAGPRSRVGVTCLVKASRPHLMLCDKVYRMRCKKGIILPAYLEVALNTPDVVDMLDRLKTGISDSGVNLTQARFSRLQVPVPSLEVQAEIVAAVDRQLSVVEHLETDIEAKLERSSALREGILDLAFGGRLVPQDSTGESATELLERIGSDKKFGAERLRGQRKSPDSTDRSKRRGRVAPSANDLSE